MQYAKENLQYSMVYCMYNMKLQNGTYAVVPMEPWPEQMEGKMLRTLLFTNVIGTPTMLMKKSAFLAVGGFCTDYRALEDWEFAIRFAKEYQIGFVPEILMDGEMLPQGVSSNLGAFFESRCRMLGTYKVEMMQEGVLDMTMEAILLRAQEYGMLEPVKKLMMLYLSR